MSGAFDATVVFGNSEATCGVCQKVIWTAPYGMTQHTFGYYPDGRMWVINHAGMVHSCDMEDIPNPYLIRELP